MKRVPRIGTPGGVAGRRRARRAWRWCVPVAAVLLGLLPVATTAAQDAPALPLAPGAAADLFDRANSAYEDERYEAAAVGYQRVIQAGIRDARVYYNLGNALYRLDKLGPAILAYETALKLAPSDERIRDNLEHVAAQRIDEVSEGPIEAGPLTALWSWHGRLSPGLVTAGFALAWLLFNSCLALAIFPVSARLRRVSSYLLAVSLVGVLMAALLLGPLIYRRDAVVRGIVIQERVDLQSVPGGGVTLTTVHEGLAVRVRDTRGDWLEIILPNGIRGWVARSSVGIV